MVILEQNGVQVGQKCKGYELVLFVSFLLVSVKKIFDRLLFNKHIRETNLYTKIKSCNTNFNS